MAHKVVLIPGDGIGPEVTLAAQQIIEAAGVPIEWTSAYIGADALVKFGDPLPENAIETIGRIRVALKGPTATPVGEGFRSVNVKLREIFDLHVNFRPLHSMRGVKALHSDVDVLLFRQNTEDLYIGEERFVGGKGGYEAGEEMIAEAISRISFHASLDLFLYAFRYALAHGRKQVTAVHKANILKLTHGLFLEAGRTAAEDFPDIKYEERIADSCAMQLVMRPQQFDVLVTTNFIGDILSDIGAGLIGGLGFAPGANIGKDCAIFEAVHGTAPDIAGQNKANPTAMILSAALMLEHLGEHKAAARIRTVTMEVIEAGVFVTPDINPAFKNGTQEMTEVICRILREGE